MFGDSVGSISAQLKKAKEEKNKQEVKKENIENPIKRVLKEEAPDKVDASQPRYQAKPKQAKTYPERTFDKYVQKGARLREEDIDILKAFCSEISSARRKLPEGERPIKRITDNTVIRQLVTIFCENIENDLSNVDYSKIQTEGNLKEYIRKILSF
jgi:hypothetical protein